SSSLRSPRGSARPSATRRASNLERCSMCIAFDSLVIEIELKRKRPSLIAGDELVVWLHDGASERSGVELSGRGLRDLVPVERVLFRCEGKCDSNATRTFQRIQLIDNGLRDPLL